MYIIIATHNLNGRVQKMTSCVLYILTLKCTHSTSITVNIYEFCGKCGNIDFMTICFKL